MSSFLQQKQIKGHKGFKETRKYVSYTDIYTKIHQRKCFDIEQANQPQKKGREAG